MCSRGDSDDEDTHLDSIKSESSELDTVGMVCKKCDQRAVVKLRMLDSLCRTCFLSSCTHKYRSTLGKHHRVKHGDRVLLTYSGGAASSAMLHMVQQALNEDAPKKLYFVPTIIYIDEGVLTNESLDERVKYTQDLFGSICNMGWQAFMVPLEMVLCDSHSSDDWYCDLSMKSSISMLYKRETTEKFQKLVSDFQTITAQEEFVWRMKLKLLIEVAKHLGCDKIFLGSSSTRLAVQLLASIAQGRGGQIQHETGFLDARYSVPFLRPLREFTSKEIAMYNHLNNIWYASRSTLTTKMQSKSSIMKLTESFVSGLQAEFPSTVSTIFRTGDKLNSVLSKDSTEQSCAICLSPLDSNNCEGCTAVFALDASELLSHKLKALKVNHVPKSVNCCAQNSDESCCEGDSKGQSLSMANVRDSLCYSCFLMVKDMTDVSLLPSFITENVRQHVTRIKMKKEIEEFLLPNDD